MQLQKEKLCGIILEDSQVRDKPNLYNIFESYLDYHDFQCLCNSPDYFERLQKNLFTMMKQFGLPTLFVTFTSIKRLWYPLLRTLHTSLHVLGLSLLNKIKDIYSLHIA